MSNRVVFAGDVVESNGKTVKENNLDIEHQFSPLTPVVIKKNDNGEVPYFMEDEHEHAVHMVANGLPFYVASCDRDFDGTVLYTLSTIPIDLKGQDPFDYIQNLIPDNISKGENSYSLNDFLKLHNEIIGHLFITGLGESAINKHQLTQE